MSNPRFLTLIVIVVAAAATRLVPHWPNFTPIAAMALFGGAYLTNKRAALAVPLLAMLASDAVLEMLYRLGLRSYAGFHANMILVYLCFAATVGLGLLLRTRRGVLPIVGTALAASLIFFFVTNFGVWAFGTMYPKTFGGLLICYGAAIPFFWNMLAGNAFYTAVLFGGFSLAERYSPNLRETSAALPVRG